MLRPDALDYYDIDLQPSAAAAASGGGGQASPSLVSSTPAGESALPSAYSIPSNLKQNFRGSLTLDAHTTISAAQYGDVPFGLELTTADKMAKLCAETEAQRAEWIKDIQAVITCKKKGVDAATLIPRTGPTMPTNSAGMMLDPHLLGAANYLLTQALHSLPEPSPIADAHSFEPNNGTFSIAEDSDGTPAEGVQRDLFGAANSNEEAPSAQ